VNMDLHLPISVIGVTHKTATVEIRESVALEHSEQYAVIKGLLQNFRIDGCFVVPTCNRTEIYLSGDHTNNTLLKIKKWLDEFKNCSHFSDESVTFTLKHEDAVSHFFQVISGLDSQIIGEPQITGQVKDGFYCAEKANTTDSILNKIFNYGMQAQKKVRNDTFLGAGAVSVSFAAVELSEKIFNKLEGRDVLLIGAGDTAELAATHFRGKGVQNIHILNRTRKNAEILAEKFEGKAFGFDEFESAFDGIDIVISATSSQKFILENDFVKTITKKRHNKPLLLIDLAIPRDIDPKTAENDGVFLYNLDDLKDIVEKNTMKRMNEIPKAQKIVSSYVDEYIEWLKSHTLSATISDLKIAIQTIVKNEHKKTLQQSNGQNDSTLEMLGNNIVNKLMRQHMKWLKKSEKNPDKKELQMDILRELYELDQPG
jgi:glutamyl-tRNA reductase